METRIGTDLNEAVSLLAADELVAIPTETVYGLAAHALHPEAVVRIFEVKNRPTFDPLIVHIGSMDQLSTVARNVPQSALDLAVTFWPGPLTLVLDKQPDVPDLVTSGLSTVGVRMPRHELTLELILRAGFPLAAPSANPFGYISPTTARHVADQLGGKIRYILDGGACTVGVESTIVRCTEEGCTILRLGGLPVEAIAAVVGDLEVATHSSSNPSAPGMLESHYAPRKAMVLGNIDDLIAGRDPERTGIIRFCGTGRLPHERILSPSGSLEEAARNLFGTMRELDSLNIDLIIAEEVPESGLGRAINDRLRRAAAAG